MQHNQGKGKHRGRYKTALRQDKEKKKAEITNQNEKGNHPVISGPVPNIPSLPNVPPKKRNKITEKCMQCDIEYDARRRI
jgi:hypothetical protein